MYDFRRSHRCDGVVIKQVKSLRGVLGPESAFRCNETGTFATRLPARPPASQPGSSNESAMQPLGPVWLHTMISFFVPLWVDHKLHICGYTKKWKCYGATWAMLAPWGSPPTSDCFHIFHLIVCLGSCAGVIIHNTSGVRINMVYYICIRVC